MPVLESLPLLGKRGPALALLLFGLLASPLVAQVSVVSSTPQVGSSNPVSPEPPVTRPQTQPCVVSLFQNLAFQDFSNKSFSYAPPAACPGPWSKVVFTADFTVTAGRQFDRTAAFYLGHANIYYGTTAEPRATLSPSWHVESDVTDLSAIFKSAQTGEAILGNIVNSTYTGIIYANAALEFYPTSPAYPAPRTADLVVPLPNAAGGATALNDTSSQLAQPVTLPTNVEGLYLDVIAQSQIGDEFWYTCVPNDVAGELLSCGNTAFRETEISIDGTPAGVAPVYPWIYTGGIDPYLWEPIPGIQTLNFKPYRVDLSPFAGVLSDGKQHTVAVSVFNANNYFLATANLLVYTDHGSQTVTGGILHNDLAAAPSPVVSENLHNTSGNVTGSVLVTSARNYSITGFVNTSHGRVETTVADTLNFSNVQQFTIAADGSNYVQDITQSTTVDQTTNTRAGNQSQSSQRQLSYPLTLNYAYTVNADGSAAQTTSADQQYLSHGVAGPGTESKVAEEVKSTDIYGFAADGAGLGSLGGSATASYTERGAGGVCYSRSLTAVDKVLTGYTDGQKCPQFNLNQ